MKSVNAAPKTMLPLSLSLNHVSFLCKSVEVSVRFYVDVMGFVLIKRPSSFDFEGAWLFNYGIGIHLLESETQPTPINKPINPKDNHISFQCLDMSVVKQNLESKNIKYVTAVVEEGGVTVDQLFFHDPDGYMVEICNCHVLPVLPITSCPLKQLSKPHKAAMPPALYEKRSGNRCCSGEVEAIMMENLAVDMMEILF